MHSTNATARRAGILYFVFMIVAIYREFLFPAFMVPGDAAATALNIGSRELTYRLGILASLAPLLLFIFLVVVLYRLFEEVDRGHALAMVLLVSIGVAVAIANLQNKFVPLVLLENADALSALTKPQRDAAALGFLRFHGSGIGLTTLFWGLWLFPFGILVIESRFFPRILGILLLIAGFAYVATSVASIAFPEHRGLVSRVMMPLYFGEVPIIFWLLLKGAKVPSQASARVV